MIAFDQVSKSYDGVSRVIDNISFEVLKGEILVLLGSSGCGKSTTLKMINRLIEPTSGTIYVNGKDIRKQNPVKLRRSIGYVFQGIGLFPHMSVQENVSIVPRMLGWPGHQINKRCRELLDLVRLPPENYAQRFPDELSGGQQQRVAVARALASDPDFLLMDEPFGALDAITRDALQQEFLDLKHRLAKTVVFVTHDIVEALTLGDRIAILHEGRLEQVATGKEILQHPATPFIRDLFAKTVNRLKAFKDTF
ncbi:MAG: ATP-binding cassette domain-containing protein [Nitrospinae bacterium]|nr:ATP-binding cassette domain-containing protein [Nitrospinota bacterium]